MLSAVIECFLAHDLTDAHGVYLPDQGFTPGDPRAGVIRHFESHLIPSVNLKDAIAKAGLWNDD
ncbi:MAG: hypothetical protein M2R45_03180 [Verrucomicrobia subdivision 3 bacterium]|nr:hypothetical protein [Limisphaerales bacterium]MCS1417745.1 hypothetical protein [Limisphaerales bacterium]